MLGGLEIAPRESGDSAEIGKGHLEQQWSLKAPGLYNFVYSRYSMVLLIFRGVLGILRAVQCVLDIPWLIFYDMLTIFYVIFDST